MQFLKTTALCLLLCCAGNARAQRGFLAKMDSMLHYRYYRVDIDTAYLRRPDRRWHISMCGNISSTGSEMNTNLENKQLKTELNADHTITTAVKIAYSGLSIALSMNPAKLSGKNTDWQLNLTAYGNRIGLDATATDSKTLKGTLTDGITDHQLKTGDVRQKLFYLNAYYAFNARRFSYPAAFQQSYIQLRSAGSWLLNASVYGSRISTVDNPAVNSHLDQLQIAVGGGYGYNWVPASHWLLHVSGAPTLALYSYGRLEIDNEQDRLKMHFPEFIISGKGAVTYRSGKWFAGANMIFNFSVNGEGHPLQVMNTRWFARSYIGVTF